MESFFRIDQGPTVCVHRCTCLKYTHRIQSWCGCSCSHLPRSPYDYMVVLFFAVVVHYTGVYVYMYIHTVHRAVLDQCFVCLVF